MASTRHTEQQGSATAGELRYRGIRPGYAVLHVATGGAIGIAAFVTLTTLVWLTLGLLPTVVGAVICASLLLAVNSALSAVHRSRMRSFLGLHITAPASMSGDGLVSRLRHVLTTAPLWKSLAYNAIVGLVLFVLGVVLVAFLAAGLVCVTAPIFGTPITLGTWGLSTQSSFTVGGAVVIGTMLVLAVPPIARAVAYADARVAIALLGRARTEELAQQVEHLALTRTGTVDAADAERRRIERDLHDGTQQRLTALAMNLGVARATLPDLSPSADRRRRRRRSRPDARVRPDRSASTGGLGRRRTHHREPARRADRARGGNPMRVVIAEDSTLLREGLIRLLAIAGIETVAAVDTAPALIEAVAQLGPDLAIVDVRMPPTWSDEGVRAALELRERWPGVAVLILKPIRRGTVCRRTAQRLDPSHRLSAQRPGGRRRGVPRRGAAGRCGRNRPRPQSGGAVARPAGRLARRSAHSP